MQDMIQSPRFLIASVSNIESPTGNATGMLSVPELILAATAGNKFVLDSHPARFSVIQKWLELRDVAIYGTYNLRTALGRESLLCDLQRSTY